jgi:hypothetical protein
MAIAAHSLTSGSETDDLDEYTTASISPTGNRLILAAIRTTYLAPDTNPGTPSLSGNGLTWAEIHTIIFNTGSGQTRQRVSLFRALGASPSAGVVTIDYGNGNDQGSVGWSIVEFSGVDFALGAGVVVQAAEDSDVDVATFAITLAAFAAANNAAYGAFAAAGAGISAGSGFTQLHSGNPFTQWKAGEDTSVDVGLSDSVNSVAGIAVEIAAEIIPVPPKMNSYRRRRT